ncbi:MAG TPA: DUF6504 family protein [bacterium]|nr:DUF6504 family protein [bacterium]
MFYCPNKVAYKSLEVETYSGYKADERPVQFTFQGSVYEVKDILDRWYEGGQISGRPTIHYFRVRTTTDRIFLLRHHPPRNRWEIQVTAQNLI